eukprot:10025240-Alexandrium_andersonii.AAC.1
MGQFAALCGGLRQIAALCGCHGVFRAAACGNSAVACGGSRQLASSALVGTLWSRLSEASRWSHS